MAKKKSTAPVTEAQPSPEEPGSRGEKPLELAPSPGAPIPPNVVLGIEATKAVIVEFDANNEGFGVCVKAIVDALKRVGIAGEIVSEHKTCRLVVPFKALV